MTSEPSSNLTQMLKSAATGDQKAFDAILAVVYDDLRAIALHHAKRERAGHTLQATALVHEAYLKLVDHGTIAWRDRVHFFAAASQIIRRILVDHARARKTSKRGGGRQRLTIDEESVASDRNVDLVELDDALARLSEIDAVQARIVEMRFFGGLTIEETSDVLGISKRTVDREWSYAKAWLHHALRPGEAEPRSPADDER